MKALAILSGLLGAGLWSGCDSSTGAGNASAPPVAVAVAPKGSVDSGGHPLSSPTVDPGTLTFEAELVKLVNDYRVSRGLSPLAESPEVADAARAHSQHAVGHRFFAHTSPEGLSPADRLTENGIAWTSVGENIAAGYATPQAVFEAWMASPTHRENIESDRWTHTGVGYAADRSPSAEFPHTHLWTEDFLQAPE